VVLESSVASGTGNAAHRFSWHEPIFGYYRPLTVRATVGAQAAGDLTLANLTADLAEASQYWLKSTGWQVTLEPGDPVDAGSYPGWGRERRQHLHRRPDTPPSGMITTPGGADIHEERRGGFQRRMQHLEVIGVSKWLVEGSPVRSRRRRSGRRSRR
jgi:hypothetical protein